MTRLLLHLGFQKTGTTSIQALLRRNRALLDDMTLRAYGDETRPLRLAARHLIAHPSADASERFRLMLRGTFLDLLEQDRAVAILSDENLLGRVLYARNGDLPGWSRRILPIVAGAVPRGMTAEIVLYTRDEDAWLRSLYGQSVKRAGERRGYPAWRAAIPFEPRWPVILDTLRAAAAPLNVTAIPMERDLSRDGFVGGGLLRRAGVDEARIARLDLPALQNPALSPAALGLKRALNHLPMPDRTRLRLSEAVERRDRRRR